MIGLFELRKDSILSSKYKKYLDMREQHYSRQIEESSQVRDSFRQSKSVHKMSPFKQKQISHLLRGIENNSQQLTEKERLLEKKY